MLGKRGGLTSTISTHGWVAESSFLLAVPGGYGFGFVGAGVAVGRGVGCGPGGPGGVADGFGFGLPDGEPLGFAA